MLSQDDNTVLTQTGPGTPMGALLRRYWTPACLSAELPDAGGDPLRVRLLGEDLVAFRDHLGRVGLVQEHCPHRGASLYYGRNEDCSLRCVYHGWAFDVEGNCVDMPSEPRPFRERIHLRAYPTHESGGIVWTYLGPPEHLTPFRDLGSEGGDGAGFLATKGFSSCSWLQAIEGNIDTAHISHLHQFDGVDDIPDDGTDRPGYPSNAMSWKFWRHDRSPRLEIEDTWYGFRYAGIRTTPNGHRHVRITAYVLPYGTIVGSIPFSTGYLMVVPIDDERCWRYFMAPKVRPNPRELGGPGLFTHTPYTTPRLAGASGVLPRLYTAENEYQIDREAQRTSTFSGIPDFGSQDLMVTESMGPVYDRSEEHLGTTDVAVIRMRSLLLNAARALEKGEAPPAVGGDLDYRSIRGAEKILEPEENWRLLGTDADPVVQEALGIVPAP